MDFLRHKKTSSLPGLQKAYDEIYQSSLRAQQAEAKSDYQEALQAWKATKLIISQQLSSITTTPKSNVESSLMTRIIEMERQCYDKINYLQQHIVQIRMSLNPTNDVYGNPFENFSSDNVNTLGATPPSSKPRPRSQQYRSETSINKHKRSTSETDYRSTPYYSAPSFETSRNGHNQTSPTLISRTPSPQGAMSAPKQLRHTMRSGKSEMKKLLGERKAASNAATLAWVHKKEIPGSANAALAAANISTGGQLHHNMERLSVNTSSNGTTKRSGVSSSGTTPRRVAGGISNSTKRPTTSSPPTPVKQHPSVSNGRSTAKTKPKQVTIKGTGSGPSSPVDTKKTKFGLIRSPSVPSNKVTRINSQSGLKRSATVHKTSSLDPSDEEEGNDDASIDEDEWIQAARKKIKGKGIDENAANQIFNDVVVKGDPVYWDDIAGLDQAKTSLKETVVYPFLRPDLFRGLREPAQGILLFGPPGTGKTMLARAVAQESQSTFFSISASSLTSKFLGESEKLVRALFLMARALAPAIIFVDEIDSLLSARSDTGEHETSRRIKTEFLVQWSALQHAAAGKEHEDVSRVLVLAATNLPWVIDEAARRRFVRRQYIPLPEAETRARHLEKLLSHQKNSVTPNERMRLVHMTDGFSGSDLTALAKDAAMGPLRELGEALLTTPTEKIRPIGFRDFEASLKTIRPSVSPEGLKVFEDWAAMYGSSGA